MGPATVDGWVELLVVLVAARAAWLTMRRPPALDWQRLLKVALSTVIRGGVEREGGSEAEQLERWRQRVLGIVAFHPAGREAHLKLRAADIKDVPVPALEGERGLVLDLAALPSAGARWERLYVHDPAVENALLGDPADLGPAYDPAAIVAGSGWDDVALWSPAFAEGLARRLSHVHLVGLGPPCEALVASAASACADLRPRWLDLDALDEGATREALRQHLAAPADRLVVWVQGEALRLLLAVLVGAEDLRDRLLLVVSIDGDPGPMADKFNHTDLDLELLRQVPWMSLQDVSGQDPLARPWRRLEAPPVPPSGHAVLETVDLGPLDLARVDSEALARALLVLSAAVIIRA